MKMKNNKKKKGFTLIELIVVIAILAILAAVAVPNFIGMTDKANTATQIAAAAEYANAINVYNTLNSTAKISAIVSTSAMDTSLGSLTPVVEFTSASCDALVLKRITFVSGTARVTDKGKLP